MAVDFSICRRSRLPAPSDGELHRWVNAALRGANCAEAGEICLSLVGSSEMKRLNRRFRGQSDPTNVLSFAAGPTPAAILGDIVICTAVTAREAEQQGKSVAAHWAHLTVHGVLHLLGYDHETETQAAVMEGLETEVLGALGYPPPYREYPADVELTG